MLFARCPNPYACQANPTINHFFEIKEVILAFDVVAQYQMLRLSRTKLLGYFFTPKTPSFAALATRNLTTVFAGILIFCCVFGLKPVRAFLFCFTSLPKPARQIRHSF
jgi:hypothetical protein